jgi:hypothetical protein
MPEVALQWKKVPRMSDDNGIHHEYERVVVSGEGATAREIRIYGSGGRLILEGWQVGPPGTWVTGFRPGRWPVQIRAGR